MEITIKLDADQAESVSRFWLAQQRQETNPATGQPMFINPYVSAADLIRQTVMATVVKTAMQTYPPASLTADLAALKLLQEKIADRAKPALVLSTAAAPV